jgi:hypothetical protein
MIAVVVIIAWALLLGLTSRRHGPFRQALLLAGITLALTAQYFIFGSS